MEIGWIMGIIFVFVTIIFLVVAFLLPEWVGITGKKAQEVMAEQQGATTATEEVLHIDEQDSTIKTVTDKENKTTISKV